MREITGEEFITDVTRSGYPSIVMFGTHSCSVCVTAKTKTIPKWETEHPKFRFFFIDVIKNEKTAAWAGVFRPNVPQVLVMVGLEVIAMFPYMPNEEQFLTAIQEVHKFYTVPSIFKRLYLLSKAILRIVKGRKLFVSGAIREKRLEKCRGCAYLVMAEKVGFIETIRKGNWKKLLNSAKQGFQDICGACGCGVKMKTKLKTESCPKKFWLEDK